MDPRKEVQITRTVAADDWNLWIGASEPHKATADTMTTPWAISVIVPHNNAVLATSADGQRVIQGPCVTLLGYEETLTPILLSTGTPKSDDDPLKTCFLRTAGNRVSDVITIETSDFVKVSIRVSYSVMFLPEQQDRWFNHDNYIQVMCEHLRSLIRSRCRALSLSVLWPQIPTLVRDTILGEKPVAGARPGRVFAENGSTVTEVEVLASTIEDKEIAQLMQRVQSQSVTLVIGDRQAQEQLSSAKLRAEVDKQTQVLQLDARERAAKLEEVARKLAHEAALAEAREAELLARERQALIDAREAATLKASWERQAQAKAVELELLGKDAEARSSAHRLLQAAELETAGQLRNLEVLLIQAQSAATVAERNAVQVGLIEAMTALGDKIMLGEVAQNMNLVTLFKGKEVGTILSEVLGGTKVMPTVRALIEKFGAPSLASPTNGDLTAKPA